MAAEQKMTLVISGNATPLATGLPQIANEFVKTLKSGTSYADETLKKAEAEAKAKTDDNIKQVAESFKNLAAGFKDGKSPLEALVGESAKLVSSFNGVGPAVGAVGDYVRSLASGVNIATEAVVLLTKAYVEGSREATTYANASTMTGNYVGLTTDQLQTKAIEIAGTQGTQALAAQSLSAAVGTGKIGGDVVSEVAAATAEMNRVLGVSIKDAVDNFVKLADEPSKASAKLNETYHYLSASTYERIVALEKQGKHEEAAALAQKSYALAMKQRTEETVGNLGTLERAWLSLTGFANRAWDAMLNIGRPVTIDQQIAEVDKRLERIAVLEAGNGLPSHGVGLPRISAKLKREKDEALTEKANLVENKNLSQRGAEVKAGIALNEGIKIRKIQDAEDKKSEKSSGVGRAETDGLTAQVERLREGYSAKARITADGLKEIDSLRKRELIDDYEVVRRKRILQLEDLKNQEDLIQGELRLARSRKGSANERERLQGRLNQVQQQRGFVEADADRNYAELDAAPQNALLRTTRQTTESIRERASALEAQNAVYGQSAEAIRELNIAQLQRQISDLDATEHVIPGYVEALRERLKVEQALHQATQKSEGLKAADEEKKKGQKKKDEEKEEGEKKEKKMAEDIGGVFKDGFVNLLEGGGRDAIDKIGKALQKKLTQSLAEAFYDETLKGAVTGFSKWLTGALKGSTSAGGESSSGGGLLGGLGDMVKGLFGGISNMFSGIWNSASSGISSLFSGGSSWFSGLLSIFSAKGNVFASSGLHAYANSVVGKPTFFPFAHGIGLMGEAGPEAIMPLRRGSDGRLGVSAPVGGSGGGSLHYAPTNVFNIDSRSDRGAVLADLDRALQVNNQGQMEQLKRLRVVPQ